MMSAKKTVINSTMTVPTSRMVGGRFLKRLHPSRQTESTTALVVWSLVYVALAGIVLCAASLAIYSAAKSHHTFNMASSSGEDDHSDDDDEEQKRDSKIDKSHDVREETSVNYVESKASEIANEPYACSRQSEKIASKQNSGKSTHEVSLEGNSSSVTNNTESNKQESAEAATKKNRDTVRPDDARMAAMRANTLCANQNRHRHDVGQPRPNGVLLRLWICLGECCTAMAQWSSSFNECVLSCCVAMTYFLLQNCCRRREQALRVRDNPARCRKRGTRDEVDEIDHHAFYVDRPTEMPRHAPRQFHAERAVPGNYWSMRLTANQLHPVNLALAATVTQPTPIFSPRVGRRVCDPALDYARCSQRSPNVQSPSPIIMNEPMSASYSREQYRISNLNDPMYAREYRNQYSQWGIRHSPQFNQAQASPYALLRRGGPLPFRAYRPQVRPCKQEFSYVYPQSRNE